MNITGKNLKTLAANVELGMMNEVLRFHNKSNINLDATFRARLSPYTLTLDQLKKLERSDYEINYFHDQDIACPSPINGEQRRQRSAQQFSKKILSFASIQQILNQTFGCAADGSRGYPSGGALYPVEVICAIFADKLADSPASGFYHYRPSLHTLQCLRKMPPEKMRTILYDQELVAAAAPSFAFIYVGVLGKIIVKYHYRGYRYALIETGCMVQQADNNAENLQIQNKLYSGFNDHELVKTMGLDAMNFLPLIIQSFGSAL